MHSPTSVTRGLALTAVACAILAPMASWSAPASESHTLERIVPASAFHGVHGLAFDRNDVLYAGSVVGQSVYRVDTNTGQVTTVVGPPQGMADDLVFLADGTMVWTAITQGAVRAQSPGGPVREIAKLASVNSINVRKQDGQLFVAQVFGGDGVWELDPTGSAAPRSIVRDVGGFNGFDIGPDGALYGPLWFKQQVVRIDPDSGAVKVVASGFHTPAAANFDSKWNLYVLDTALGDLIRVDIASGAKRTVAKLSTSLDNLAIDSKDRIFVSNMADNGIQEVNAQTGEARQILKGALAIPLALAAVSRDTRDTLYVADVFAFRSVDGTTGKVTDIARAHAAETPIEYPVAVTANSRHVVLTHSEGLMQKYAHGSATPLSSWHLRGVQNAIELEDGSVLALMRDRLLRITPDAPEGKEIAGGLQASSGIALRADRVYIAEGTAGRIIEIDLDTGNKTVIATGLQNPRSVASDAAGNLFTIELSARQLTQIDAKSGVKKVLATDLPVGGTNNPTSSASVTLGADGTLYFNSDIENSIWRAKPKDR